MFAAERQEEIMRILQKEGRVEVKELKAEFRVTEDCIRKDLNKLENEGRLKRIYGGAILIKPNPLDRFIEHRVNLNIPAKELIAKKAFSLIRDNTTIYLDVSTTSILLAKLLSTSELHLTVVTNMIEIPSILLKNPRLTVISCGGTASPTLNAFIGTSAIEFIKQYNFDMAFLGCCGIDFMNNMFTTFETEDGLTKKAVIEVSKKTYMLMEKDKFYYCANYKFAPIEQIDGIVIESTPTSDQLKLLNHTDVVII